jgi:hypothetical protein
VNVVFPAWLTILGGQPRSKGADVTIMEQLGHFPMSENPETFRRYITPVLSRILERTVRDNQGVYV